MRIWELLLANANIILLTVVIPMLLIALFAIIRRVYGNSVTAMPDVLIFLVSIDFYFALSPNPWVSIVHPSVESFFPALYFSFGLISIMIFIFTLGVEKKLIHFWVKRNFPDVIYSRKPDISKQRFPYLGITFSWFFIASAVALNMLPFSGR